MLRNLPVYLGFCKRVNLKSEFIVDNYITSKFWTSSGHTTIIINVAIEKTVNLSLVTLCSIHSEWLMCLTTSVFNSFGPHFMSTLKIHQPVSFINGVSASQESN